MIRVIEQTTKEQEDEFWGKYNLYRKLFYTTTLSRDELMEAIGLCRTTKVWRRITREWRKNEEHSSYERTVLIRHGKWPQEVKK